MKLKKSYEVHPAPDEIVGHLGQVQLVRKADGNHELVGGTAKAQAMVRNWCAVYAPFLEFVGATEDEIVLGA
jgi:hypothetical protein